NGGRGSFLLSPAWDLQPLTGGLGRTRTVNQTDEATFRSFLPEGAQRRVGSVNFVIQASLGFQWSVCSDQ
ncbi:MAG: hypothetical protein E6471_04140, partial [Bradyrhizobium sp.]|nr:hypothetical protein [Bradyrhizobium sp.]